VQGNRESWAKRERPMEARQCAQCRRWFTVKRNRRVDVCSRCLELEEGQASPSQ
jgi:hypothetical protein